MDWVDWQALETRIPLDELPTFHRAFLEKMRPGEADWSTAFLRQVQGKVQASLKVSTRRFSTLGSDLSTNAAAAQGRSL